MAVRKESKSVQKRKAVQSGRKHPNERPRRDPTVHGTDPVDQLESPYDDFDETSLSEPELTEDFLSGLEPHDDLREELEEAIALACSDIEQEAHTTCEDLASYVEDRLARIKEVARRF